MNLRERVAGMISAAGLSQVELARRSGVGQSTISSILSGQRSDLRADAVARLARGCGLSPAALGRLMYDSIPAPDPGEKSSGL